MFDPSLEGTRQHRWMRKHNNVKPQISWSQMRRRFTPGFEDLLDRGLQAGWYDPNDPLDVLLFRWLFVPWLQTELNSWRDSHNRTCKRADKNKILPHGRPQLIFEAPHMFDSLDFKVGVSKEAIEEVREHYAPSDDPVFQLVPPAFHDLAAGLYEHLGCPQIYRETIWGIYVQMLVQIRHTYAHGPGPDLEAAAHAYLAPDEDEHPPIIPLTAGLRELQNSDAVVGADGFYYMGGVDKGFADPEESVATLDVGGGMHAGDMATLPMQDNYPASYDLEDEAPGLETHETAMVCAEFSDDDTASTASREW